jgi:enamine deaminase RidA (YjgF/YER057c/UK114 family)
MSVVRHEPWGLGTDVVEAGGLVFTSGVVSEDNTLDMKGQTRDVLKQVDRLLALAGTDKSKIVSTTIWVTDIRNREAMNEVWKEWVDSNNLPARACVEAKLADPLLLLEIMVVAAK